MDIKTLQDKYAGKIGFVVGAGPSLHFQDLSKIKDYPIIAVNSAIVKFTDLDCQHLYFLSDDWDVSNWSYFIVDLPKMNCTNLLFKAKLSKYVRHLDPEKIVWFDHKYWFNPAKNKKYEDGLTFTKDASLPIIGARSSMGSAVHFAYIMGCNPIVLLGCDCCYNGNKRYFWQFEGENRPYRLDRKSNFCRPDGGKIKDKPVDHHCIAFLDYWKNLAEHADKQNIKVINASDGILDCFKKMKYEDILEKYNIIQNDTRPKSSSCCVGT